MTNTEAHDLIHRMALCYHDSLDPSLPVEDIEWNRIEFGELRDKLVCLLSTTPTPSKEETP